MGDESVFTFDKIIKSPDYENAKDSHSKRSKSIGIDLKQHVDKSLNPSLPVPAVEEEDKSNGL